MGSRHAKVVVLTGTFGSYRAQLAVLAGPGLDTGVLQVGVHEGIVRPHLLRQIRSRHPGIPLDQLLRDAGANRVEWLTEEVVHTLYLQRIVEDLDPRVAAAVPGTFGGRSWHLQAVNVDAAWAALGGPEAIDWRGVRVGQLDTGYTRHRAFGHGEPGGSWLVEPLCRTFMGSDLPPDFMDPAPQPDTGVDPMPAGGLFQGHGTRVGAVISGHCVLDAGFTFRGVAPKVPHVMVRICDSVCINDRQEEFARGLRHLVDVAQVDVVNVSLGIFPGLPTAVLRQAIAHAHSKGVIVVCAAGNHVDPVVAPANLPETIAVAGVTWETFPWFGSAFGPEVDFSAPASGIFRPQPQREGIGRLFSGGGDGTSYATAITTGSAALWLRCWAAEIQSRYGRTAQRVEAFRRAAAASCRLPAGWHAQPFGAGIIDAGRLCTDRVTALP
jgi:hypothetical protein